MTARVRAPALQGAGGWIGIGALSLGDLRGRVVLLDFFTGSCVNCVRTTEALRGLQRRFADELVVVGVHSPKFPREAEHDAVRAAVARMRIEHPVLDDPGGITWDVYAVRAWPTLVLVDPTGYEVARWSGEGHEVEIAAAIERLLNAVSDPGTLAIDPEAAGTGELSWPGKVCADRAGGRLAIADTGHDRVLVCAVGGEVLRELGGFYQPQGVRFDGEDLLVCETGADRVWRVAPDGTRTLLTDRVAAPWDILVWEGHVVVAGAGRHRLWMRDAAGEAQVVAGMGVEQRLDGPALQAALAQPSGLAVTRGGELAFVDAETSALRVLDRPAGSVRTLVGDGLFDWGDRDGDGNRARMQHPLGVASGLDGDLYVADTYNDAVRVWRAGHLWTVPVAGLAEPGGLDVLPDGRLVVADSANHRIVLVDPLQATAVPVDVGRPGSVDVAAPVVAQTLVLTAGGTLEAELDLPLDGDVLDAAGGPPVRVRAHSDDDELLPLDVEWELDVLPARVSVALGEGSGRVTLELRVATCGPDACRLRRTQRAYDLIVV